MNEMKTTWSNVCCSAKTSNIDSHFLWFQSTTWQKHYSIINIRIFDSKGCINITVCCYEHSHPIIFAVPYWNVNCVTSFHLSQETTERKICPCSQKRSAFSFFLFSPVVVRMSAPNDCDAFGECACYCEPWPSWEGGKTHYHFHTVCIVEARSWLQSCYYLC